MRQCVYHGLEGELLGKTALVRGDPAAPWVELQFDDLSLPTYLTHAWIRVRSKYVTRYPEWTGDTGD